MSLHGEKYRNFVAGWGAGMLETLVLYPQNKVVFRQQLHGFTTQQALRQLKSEGCRTLYRGALLLLLQRPALRSVMFGMFDIFDQKFGCARYQSPSSHIACYSCAAFLAGLTEAFLCPFERTLVILQTREFNTFYRNTLVLMRSLAGNGIMELYRGFSLVVLRNGLSGVIFFNSREPLRNMVVEICNQKITNNERNKKKYMRLITVAGDFASGAVLGAVISTLFFPLNVVKQRMQSTVATPFLSPFEVFRIIWKERNGSVRELFRGGTLNFIRSLCAWGITNAAFEALQHAFSK